jgi:hypothetical protein
MELLCLHYIRCVRTKCRGEYCDLRERERERNKCEKGSKIAHDCFFINFSSQLPLGIRVNLHVYINLRVRLCLPLHNGEAIFISDCVCVKMRCRDQQIKEEGIG